MKRTTYILSVFTFLAILGNHWKSNELLNIPENWPKPFYDLSKNPLRKETVQLGRALFYDPILSRDSTISCSGCHLVYTAFTHVDHKLSHGIDGKIGNRNSPALMNLAWGKTFMWDGAVNHLDVQALAPINNPLEMDESISNVVKKLKRRELYLHLFKESFGETEITGQRILLAISQFMLTLVSSDSKYDRVKNGIEEFTDQELNGYRLFAKNCSSCHTEPLFTNHDFANNGLKPDTILKDIGRMKITGNSDDSLLFKVPTLRNIEFSYPYMHDGRFKSLYEVLDHYTEGIIESKTLSAHLKNNPIVLNQNEKTDLIAFLLTLTDRNFLFNKDYSYPREVFFPTK